MTNRNETEKAIWEQDAYSVLYYDGELVIQRGEETDPCRGVLVEGPLDHLWPQTDWRAGITRISCLQPVILSPSSDSCIPSFRYCENLKDISGLAGWDVSRVTNMDGMFWGCKALADLTPLSGWNVSAVTSMAGMFEGCHIYDLDALRNWDTSSLTNMDSMFADSSLWDVSGIADWDVSHVTDMDYLFDNCPASDVTCLEKWDVRSAWHKRLYFEDGPMKLPSWCRWF